MTRQQRRSLIAATAHSGHRLSRLTTLKAEVAATRAEAKATDNPTRAQRTAWRRRRTLAYRAMERV